MENWRKFVYQINLFFRVCVCMQKDSTLISTTSKKGVVPLSTLLSLTYAFSLPPLSSYYKVKPLINFTIFVETF